MIIHTREVDWSLGPPCGHWHATFAPRNSTDVAVSTIENYVPWVVCLGHAIWYKKLANPGNTFSDNRSICVVGCLETQRSKYLEYMYIFLYAHTFLNSSCPIGTPCNPIWIISCNVNRECKPWLYTHVKWIGPLGPLVVIDMPHLHHATLQM